MTAFWARDGVTGIHGLLIFHYSLWRRSNIIWKRGAYRVILVEVLSFGRDKDAGNELQQDHARKVAMFCNG